MAKVHFDGRSRCVRHAMEQVQDLNDSDRITTIARTLFAQQGGDPTRLTKLLTAQTRCYVRRSLAKQGKPFTPASMKEYNKALAETTAQRKPRGEKSKYKPKPKPTMNGQMVNTVAIATLRSAQQYVAACGGINRAKDILTLLEDLRQ